MTSPDLTAANIDKIAELFPGVVTESPSMPRATRRGRSTSTCFARSSPTTSSRDRRSATNSTGPASARPLFAANAPIAKTLRPVREESVDFDTTKNLFIEGDNLDALKLLQESYLGKVKLIYIDPPYNTGNDFVYEDDFAETSCGLPRNGPARSTLAATKLVANTESNGRFHSDWLSMMYPRLKLARNLLADDGVIFVSIDDHESANLSRLLDEVFGEQNFIGRCRRGTTAGHERRSATREDIVRLHARLRHSDLRVAWQPHLDARRWNDAHYSVD